MMLSPSNTLLRWLPFAFTVTALAGMVYITVQQNYRQSANDPQVQLAEESAAAMTAGTPYASIVPARRTDIAQSLMPFLLIADDVGKPIASSGLLEGTLPMIPPGVFTFAKKRGENRVTWEPRPGLRQAIVVVPFTGPAQKGFVVAGRSLREAEQRVVLLGTHIELVWLFSLLGTLLLCAVTGSPAPTPVKKPKR